MQSHRGRSAACSRLHESQGMSELSLSVTEERSGGPTWKEEQRKLLWGSPSGCCGALCWWSWPWSAGWLAWLSNGWLCNGWLVVVRWQWERRNDFFCVFVFFFLYVFLFLSSVLSFLFFYCCLFLLLFLLFVSFFWWRSKKFHLCLCLVSRSQSLLLQLFSLETNCSAVWKVWERSFGLTSRLFRSDRIRCHLSSQFVQSWWCCTKHSRWLKNRHHLQSDRYALLLSVMSRFV